MELGIAAERVRGDFCDLRKNRRKLSKACDDVVLQRRFELRTPCLKGRCSAY